MELKDKIIIVTGAANGLGKYLAAEFETAGAKVITADIDEKFSVKTDVRKEEDIKALVAQTLAEYGHVDIWVNNAGIQIKPTTVEETDMAAARNLFEVNLFGTMLGSKHALGVMKKQGFGAIVNMMSTAALEGKKGIAVYSASKHAINGFTKSLRAELADTDIKVYSIFPGGVQTDIYKDFKPADFDKYMDAHEVARKIVSNLSQDVPEEELIIRRPQ